MVFTVDFYPYQANFPSLYPLPLKNIKNQGFPVVFRVVKKKALIGNKLNKFSIFI